MVVEQKALVEEALLARSRLRARRAYVQALRGGANRAVALEAAVDSLLEADRTISEAEARVIVGHEVHDLEASDDPVTAGVRPNQRNASRGLNLLGNVRVKAQIEKLDARTDC